MAKLALNPAPTFKATVRIPVPGQDPVPVVMSFKYRTRTELDAHFKRNEENAKLPEGDPAKLSEAQILMDCVEGWDVDDPCTLAVMEQLIDTYCAAALEIATTYYQTLQAGRKGN